MEITLVMMKADGTRRDFPLTKPRSVVGRISSCDLRIPLSAVSRNHCEIFAERGTVKARDLNSSNGTFHNGTRISREVALNPGDRLQVGPVIFTLVIDGVPAKLDASETMMTADANVAEREKAMADAARKREKPKPKAKPKRAEKFAERPATTTTKDRGQGLDGLLADVESDLRDQGDAAKAAQQPKAKKPARKPPPKQMPVIGDDDDDLADGLDLDDPIAALEAMGAGDSDSHMSWLTDEDEDTDTGSK